MLLLTACVLGHLVLSPAAKSDEGDQRNGRHDDSFKFDAPDAHFESWKWNVGCLTATVRGTVEFFRLGSDKNFPPGITVIAHRGARSVALWFSARKSQLPFRVALLNARNGQMRGAIPYPAKVGQDGKFDFVFTWSADGAVGGEVGGTQASLALGGLPNTIELNGFTGAGQITIDPALITGPDCANHD